MPFAHFFSVLASNVQVLVVHGGYTLLAVFAVLEGVPLIGILIPGHIAVIMAGFMARIGILDLRLVLLVSILGAITGDAIGYYLGRRYGLKFIERLRPYFSRADTHIEKAQKLLSSHTGKAMIFGRFMPATRAFMPFLVGASSTHPRSFWFWNILGAISWCTLSIMIGYVFGAGYHAAAGMFGRLVAAAIIGTVLIIWGYRFVNARFHIFRRYELFTLTLNVLSLWGLAATIEHLGRVPFRLGFDVWVGGLMSNAVLTAPILVSIARFLSFFGGVTILSILAIFWFIFLVMRRRWRSATLVILSMSSVILIVPTMKEFFMSTRPLAALSEWTFGSAAPFVTLQVPIDPSFPSSHAATAAAFFLVLAYLLAPKIHSRIKRELMILACILAMLLIGLSRLVLNVHWVSDVVGGWTLGIFLASSSILLVRYLSALFVKRSQRKSEQIIQI